MKSDALRNRVLRRIAHTRGVLLKELETLDDEEIITQYWRYLKMCEIPHFSQDAIESCRVFLERMKLRAVRNRRFAEMRQLESNGYFELAKAKERDPGLYDQIVGRDLVGRPDTMNFSEVLMRCWMHERDPDTGQRKIDIPLKTDVDEETYEETEEEEDEPDDQPEPPPPDMINPDLSPEERQEEFITLMKERFVDGKDPDYDYETISVFDHDQDSDMTSDWFEEEEETNLKPAETEQSDEEDYMTMDVSSFDKKS